MSALDNNILNRAFSSFYPTTIHPEPNPQPLEAFVPSLTFLSSDFMLTEKEKDLFYEIFHQSKLTPNVTLFDLLFFDLHKQLSSLRQLVGNEVFNQKIKELELYYVSVIEDKQKDTTQLKIFLKNIVLDFIKSNKIINQALTEEIRFVKDAGDSRFIATTLFKRVALLKKFEGAPACHPQLFNHPLSSLIKERECSICHQELRKIFENNGLFLQTIFNALAFTNPRLSCFREETKDIVRLVTSLGNLESKGCFIKNPDFHMSIESYLSLLIQCESSSYWIKIVQDSLFNYKAIIDKVVDSLQSLQTKERDLKFQAGKAPILAIVPKGSLDPQDILAKFKAANMIEPSFLLTLGESNLIEEILDYPLNPEMTMLDFLGFALYDRLETFKKSLPKLDKEIAITQDLISTHCLLFYVGLFRSHPDIVLLLGAVNGFSDIFASSNQIFLNKIEEILEKFQQLVKNIKPNSGTPTQRQIKVLEASRDKALEQFRDTVLPLQNLLIKLLQSNGFFHLLTNSVSMYQKRKTLEHSSHVARLTIEKYWNYVKRGYQSGVKLRLVSVEYDFDSIMEKDLPFSIPPLEKEISSFKTKIAKATILCSKQLKFFQEELFEAICRKLDHQTWLTKHKLTITYKKSQEEFIEYLHSRLHFSQMYSALLSDLLQLVESKVFPSEMLTTYSCFFRIVQNICRYTENSEHSSSPLLPSLISSKFKMVLDPIKMELNKHQKLFNYATTSQDAQDVTFAYTTWLDFLVPHKNSVISLFENSLQVLSVLKIELLEDLRNEWSNLTLEELQRLDLAEIEEAIFLEGTQLIRPILILSDMLALLQIRYLSEEGAIIPKELADVMILSGIDEMHQALVKAKTPSLVPVITQQIITPTPAPVAIKRTPPVHVIVRQKKPVPRRQVRQQRAPVSVTTSITAPPPEIRELANLTKSYQVLAKLRTLGFFEKRQKGSHHILKSPQGGTVVVPGNKSLPPGTRSNIAKQTAEALHQ